MPLAWQAAINDGLGHQAGDVLLKTVGDRLAGAVRETDLVARFGGIPLRRQPGRVLIDQSTTIHIQPRRSELLQRLLADVCEL